MAVHNVVVDGVWRRAHRARSRLRSPGPWCFPPLGGHGTPRSCRHAGSQCCPRETRTAATLSEIDNKAVRGKNPPHQVTHLGAHSFDCCETITWLADFVTPAPVTPRTALYRCCWPQHSVTSRNKRRRQCLGRCGQHTLFEVKLGYPPPLGRH